MLKGTTNFRMIDRRTGRSITEKDRSEKIGECFCSYGMLILGQKYI